MSGAAVPLNVRPPAHIAIIMDGNGRWATRRGLPRTAGHKKGVEAVRRVLEAAREMGVSYLTLFSFSSENWGRPEGEVSELMHLLRFYLRGEIATLHKNGVRLRIIGDRSRLAPDIITLIQNAESLTANNTGLTLVMALSYGSRQEIANAARHLAEEVRAGRMTPDQVTVERLGASLYTQDIPDPDLLIRTSGEKRISNFLLWQMAYAELVFVETLWPDFGRQELDDAIQEFHRRDRRYGATVGTR
ncbi:isoprenyl transferase [Nitrospirillum pindoramense]|uniref:Isoprenyl transferase n=1 Tax=Nitrospirillum amazonense TaxID=28077 RepID=A0A560HE37_9PROT|nr:isoprenyl transferase [Nitrospirillum amazonense]TWB44301.1 undecaprenyl pyrophosphate synthetase [Nitrospirillum amazonense]